MFSSKSPPKEDDNVITNVPPDNMRNNNIYDDDLHVPCPPHTTERRLTARIDYHIVPFLIVLYLLAFLDRVNIANARSFGLEADLSLGGVEYNTALTIFFVPYVIFEIPSNILLKRFSPRIWLSICCLGFGVVSVCQGLVRSYGGLLATRFFLGVFECGMFPGCFYLLGMWYRRGEAQKRYSLFFGSTSLAGAFGGLLASAIGEMDGMRFYRGWRWIFIIEGSLTFLVGVVFLFTFPSFPEQATWLAEDERAYVRARLQADQGRNAAERKITLTDVANVMRDAKIWIGGLMYFGLIVPAYGYAYFSPAIITTYHYGAIQTQLHSVPPWAVAFGFAMVVAVLSDWARHRFLFAIGPICLAIAGFAILLAVHDDTDLQYAALFLVCMGTYSAMPVIVCWFNMNLGGHHRRAIGTAWQIGFGNIGGIIATYSFLSTDAPYYRKGYAISISFICLSAASCVLYAFVLWRENRRREKSVHDVGLTDYEKTELGDLNPEFRYML
ncbi:major facilitator superfamily domain-containing protein [Diplogelasinospora grovesii]|uniref:Major facilitator superfamily domain-containing protein n=1 Tax=Diplogelasinospora grovesii TaxID=303347 RepID=A0AAN6NHN4_9PEZI|nr:major facilitator superfamily domain-containing protein [Diplogelasinospora grovesii]